MAEIVEEGPEITPNPQRTLQGFDDDQYLVVGIRSKSNTWHRQNPSKDKGRPLCSTGVYSNHIVRVPPSVISCKICKREGDKLDSMWREMIANTIGTSVRADA